MERIANRKLLKPAAKKPEPGRTPD